MADEQQQFKEWVILEVMGHKKVAGLLSETQLAGAQFLRIDIPGPDGFQATQLYRPESVYCITPVSEEIARGLGDNLINREPPVRRWELPPAEKDDDDEN